MRILTCATAVLVLFAHVVRAEGYVRFSTYYDHGKPLFCFEAPLERVRHLPLWDGIGEPPVRREQAVQIGAKELALSTSPKRVELIRIDVRLSTFNGEVWYYLIEYVPSKQRSDAAQRPVAVVLFDGRPVRKTPGNCTRSGY